MNGRVAICALPCGGIVLKEDLLNLVTRTKREIVSGLPYGITFSSGKVSLLRKPTISRTLLGNDILDKEFIFRIIVGIICFAYI